MVSQVVNSLHKNGPIPFWSPLPPLPPNNYSKISLYLYALTGTINMTTMISQHTKFPLTLVPPGKPNHQAIYCPTANFGRLSRGKITNPILITAFDAYLIPRSPGTVSLVHKYINLKELYN